MLASKQKSSVATDTSQETYEVRGLNNEVYVRLITNDI
jgi:hypothetical protein